jgi:hypothetical protein
MKTILGKHGSSNKNEYDVILRYRLTMIIHSMEIDQSTFTSVPAAVDTTGYSCGEGQGEKASGPASRIC